MRITAALGVGLLSLTLLGACSDDDTPVTAGDDQGSGPGSPSGDDIDAGAPDIVGTITSIEPFVPVTEDCTPAEDLDPDGAVSNEDPPICTPEGHDVVGTVLVEEDPNDPQGGRKISFTATDDTRFSGQAADRDVTSFDDLAEGQQVRAWVPEDGACAESYPEQCGLDALDVTG
jgi:hypothetical protein